MLMKLSSPLARRHWARVARYWVVVLGLSLGVAACTDSPNTEVDGSGNIRAVHAVNDLGQIGFLIEGIVLAEAQFQTITPYSNYDALQYDFNFDFNSGITSETERLATTSLNVAADTNYTLVLAGTGTNPELITIAQPPRAFSADDTILEVFFGNFARNAGTVDIYFGAEGFDPAATTSAASGLALNGTTPLQDIEAGTYEFVATAPGDATTVLIRSEAIELLAIDSVMVNLFDAAEESNGDFVFIVGGDRVGARLVDQTALATVAVINGFRTAGNIDIFIDDETVTPVIADLPFAAISASTPIPEGDNATVFSLNVTAAGNVGAPLFDVDTSLADGSSNLLVLAQVIDSTDFAFLLAAGTRRPLFDAGRLGLVNTSKNFELLDLFLVESANTFENANPRAQSIGRTQDIAQFTLAADTYQLYLTNGSDDSLIIGPVDIVLERGDVTQIVITDAVDPNSLEILTFDLNAL
ncbi:MAG: DUF4397 domain-containing protein [Woeseiaceae bacterium]